MTNELKTIQDDTKIMLKNELDGILATLHQKYNTISGDIYPEQATKLESSIKDLSKLIAEQIHQNLEL